MNEEELKTVTFSEATSLQEERQEVLPVGYLIDNRYRVVSVIGEGGNGVVYRVHQIFLDKDMALKTINRRRTNPMVLKRFQQEARAANALDHPNLIKVLDFGVLENDQPFLVMELIDGVSFAQYLRQRGALSPAELMPMFISVCEGLAYAHDRGVVHRDIKPGNIMMLKGEDPSRVMKIVDFGIAKITHDEGEIQALTRTGEIFGSPLYMSPEQCLGAKTDNRADIYSLGCVMYEALTGTPPFFGETAMATMMKHTSEMPPPMAQASLGRQFPKGLENIIFKMLSKAPEDRYSHALMIAHELRTIDPQSAVVDAPRQTATAAPKTQRQSRTAVIAALCLLSLALGISLDRIYAGGPGPNTSAKQSESQPPQPREPVEYSLKHTSQPLEFPPLSSVFRRADGKMMRRFHIPPGLDVRVLNTGEIMHKSYFDLPEDCIIHILIRPTVPVTGDLFAGLDPRAVGRLELSQIMTLDEATMQSIANLKSLILLNVDYTNISGKDLKYLNALPNLRTLAVQGTDLTLEDLLKLKRLREFTSLSVANLKQGARLLDELAKANKIVTFNSTNIDVSDDDLVRLAKLTNLQDLTLCGCPRVTDRGVKQLISLRNLRNLDMRHCGLTYESADTIKKLPHLMGVQLSVDGWSRDQTLEFIRRIRAENPRCSFEFFRLVGKVEQKVDVNSFDADLEKEAVETIDSIINNK